MKSFLPALASLAWLAAPPASAAEKSVEAAPESTNARTAYAACLACHAPADSSATGPSLHGVSGRPAATSPGFRYSRALKKSGLVWDDATLDAFLADPQAVAPGNLMPYPGLPDETARRELIAFLKTLP